MLHRICIPSFKEKHIFISKIDFISHCGYYRARYVDYNDLLIFRYNFCGKNHIYRFKIDLSFVAKFLSCEIFFEVEEQRKVGELARHPLCTELCILKYLWPIYATRTFEIFKVSVISINGDYSRVILYMAYAQHTS